ncbi:MAG: bacterioferritin [Acidimicrobiia bacterium]|jgi:bacterioferritin
MSDPVVGALNGLIAVELVAVNQYFVHAKICQHWGYEKLAARFREVSIEEMRDVEAYMDRVLLLGGLPNLQRLDAFQVGENVPEALDLAVALEESAVQKLKDAVALCESVDDLGTAALLRPKVADEEAQLDWLRTQRSLIDQIGEALYLASQVNI